MIARPQIRARRAALARRRLDDVRPVITLAPGAVQGSSPRPGKAALPPHLGERYQQPPFTWRVIDDKADNGPATLDAPRRRGWPLPGRWSEASLDDPGASDPARYS